MPEHLVNGLGPLVHEALSELLCFLRRRMPATPHLRLLGLGLRTGHYQPSDSATSQQVNAKYINRKTKNRVNAPIGTGQ